MIPTRVTKRGLFDRNLNTKEIPNHLPCVPSLFYNSSASAFIFQAFTVYNYGVNIISETLHFLTLVF